MLPPDEGSLGEVLVLEDWPMGPGCANLPMVKCSGLEVDIIDYAQSELLIRRMLSVSASAMRRGGTTMLKVEASIRECSRLWIQSCRRENCRCEESDNRM